MNRRTGFSVAFAIIIAACGHGAPSSVKQANATHGSQQRSVTASTVGSAQVPTTAGESQRKPSSGREPPSTTSPSSAPNSSGNVVGRPRAGTDTPHPSPPGTYRYVQRGSTTTGGKNRSVPPEGNIQIDAPTGGASDSWTQVWHSYKDSSEPPADTTYRFDNSGIAIVSMASRVQQSGESFVIECHADPPIEVMSWPPQIGYTFSGQASCGSFSASISGSIDGSQTSTVGTESVSSYSINMTITTTGSLNFTDHQVDWYSPALSLLVHTSDDAQGTYGLTSFSSRIVRDLKG
jgi:hypothetical protein